MNLNVKAYNDKVIHMNTRYTSDIIYVDDQKTTFFERRKKKSYESINFYIFKQTLIEVIKF